MKSFLTLLTVLTITLVFSSCTTAYKSGQTPDDVYYSPGRPVREEARVERENDRSRYNQEEYYSDRYTRMKIRNRSRWSSFDDYYRDPYAYTYRGSYCNCDFNPRLYWTSYYSPYAPAVVVSPRAPIYSRPRTYNLQVFDRPKPVTPAAAGVGSKPQSTNRPQVDRSSETGSTLRDVFSSGSSSTSKPASSSSSSSSSGSSSSGSGSRNNGNAPVRKF